VRSQREESRTSTLAERLDVRAPNLKARVGSLSGGNQQKVLFAKWLATEPQLLIADEPTRGIDVAAKQQIHELIAELAAGGMAVLLISSEIEEVLGLAHRVLVMRGGRVVDELSGAAATQESVMRAAFATPASTPEGEQS
jgi:ABC-type sugar transport system ATPase subunit